jgi:hypothetical protein
MLLQRTPSVSERIANQLREIHKQTAADAAGSTADTVNTVARLVDAGMDTETETATTAFILPNAVGLLDKVVCSCLHIPP